MRRRRVVALAAVGVVLAVGSAVAIQLRPEPVCGCSVMPAVIGAAGPVAERFTDLVRAGDRSGAWAMLTDAARRRYGDPDRFEPTLRTLAAGYAVFGPASAWLLLERDSMTGMLARPVGTPPTSATFLIVEPVPDGWRVDPQPLPLSVTAAPGEPQQIRVDVTPAGSDPLSWSVNGYDAAGEGTRLVLDGTPGRYGLGRTADPVLVVVTGTDGSNWRAGFATVPAREAPSTSTPR